MKLDDPDFIPFGLTGARPSALPNAPVAAAPGPSVGPLTGEAKCMCADCVNAAVDRSGGRGLVRVMANGAHGSSLLLSLPRQQIPKRTDSAIGFVVSLGWSKVFHISSIYNQSLMLFVLPPHRCPCRGN